MDTGKRYVLKRIIFSLAAGAALSGCAVYAPPPAYTYDNATVGSTYYYPYGYSYDYYGYNYGYPAYVWPSVSLGFGYYGGSYHGYRGGYRGGSYWRGNGNWSGWRGGGGTRGGGWRGGRR